MKLYAARDKNTGKLVNGITNPSHKFWQRKYDCEFAIRKYNSKPHQYKTSNYDLELVEFELVEIKEES